MNALVVIVRLIGQLWIGLGVLPVVAILTLSWYRRGFGQAFAMLNPWDFKNYVTVAIILGPGLALVYLADALRQRTRRAVLAGGAGLLIAGILFGVFVWAARRTHDGADADDRTREYKAAAVRVLNNSAMMYEHRNYFVTHTSGSVGKEGIPDQIKLGDSVTVKGKTIRVRHIFVTDILEDLKWGGKVLARKGDVRCMIVESEENLPYGDEKRNRRWIHVDNCEVLASSGESQASPRSTLYTAIAEGRLEEVKRLTTSSHLTQEMTVGRRPGPLFYALIKKQQEIAQYLVDGGADVNARYEGVTPLYLAIVEHYTDLAKVMIRKGADIDARQSGRLSGGGTPFFLAVSLQNYREDEIIDLFLTNRRPSDVHEEDPHGRSVLVWSIVNHHVQIAKWLLDHGANVNTLDRQGETPLQHAVYRGAVEIVPELLRRKADSEAKDKHGLTPLMQALAYYRQSPTSDFVEIGDLLIRHGANVNARTPTGETPLMFAAAVNRTDLAEAMVNGGANVNAQNEQGHTALMAAAGHGFEQMVELLLERGAKVDVRAKDGKAALSFARESKNRKTEDLLRRKGATD